MNVSSRRTTLRSRAACSRGFSNKKIAEQLAISLKIVDHNVSAVLGKLNASSRGEAVASARESGLV